MQWKNWVIAPHRGGSFVRIPPKNILDKVRMIISKCMDIYCQFKLLFVGIWRKHSSSVWHGRALIIIGDAGIVHPMDVYQTRQIVYPTCPCLKGLTVAQLCNIPTSMKQVCVCQVLKINIFILTFWKSCGLDRNAAEKLIF